MVVILKIHKTYYQKNIINHNYKNYNELGENKWWYRKNAIKFLLIYLQIYTETEKIQ